MSYKYANAVYGNLAYGAPAVDRPPRALERPVETELENHGLLEQPEIRERQRIKSTAKHGISVFAIMGCISIACLLFLVLMSHIELAQISKESAELTEQLSTLEAEEIKRRLEYESAFDLNEIESYAVNVLGMSKAGENQVYYIQRRANDQAVVLEENTNNKGMMDSISSLLSRISDLLF